jgi:LCP family protein required for cell wall assembly
MGGGNHPGALLTDTIMVASIKYNENPEEPPQVAMISIPRDLSVPFESRFVRINSIYAYGEMQDTNDETYSGRLAAQTINNITGLPIHYYLRVDFEGFKQIIDSLGGVEVDVQNSFYDPMYPTENYGYQQISFEKGLITLDGDLALKYARSRHGIITDGSGSEGSDFARAKRQQQILTGIKNKAFSIGTMTNPKTINEILGALGDHVRTDLEPWEMLRLVDLARNINNDEVINNVIDQESGFLTTTSGRNNAYLLMPINNSFDEIKAFCSNIFNAEVIQTEEAKIAVLNGTTIPELARSNGIKLQNEDFNVVFVGNSIDNDYEKTVIYDLSEGKMPNTLKTLMEKYDANISTIDFSSQKIVKYSDPGAEDADFVVILGLDSEI